MLETAEQSGRVVAQSEKSRESLEKIVLAVLHYRVVCRKFFGRRSGIHETPTRSLRRLFVLRGWHCGSEPTPTNQCGSVPDHHSFDRAGGPAGSGFSRQEG